ncbi:ribonucleotide-diphosphate reductase subunit beta, partial [uncultured Corynebacterium sp.]|uniref:ribonucleotide-diphosphate reductase subunit beta n=1 Tax=uncultured Corynebacterium sp. TaxID=159447 RepID=UPI002614B188
MLTPINWNTIQDPVDKTVWDRLTANFWLDTKVPVSNDLDSWRKMTPDEQEVVKRVFASLTLLDTV